MRRRTRRTIRVLARRTLLFLALLLAFRLLWGWEASLRLARVQNALRANGVPLPFQPARIPDDQNPVACRKP